MKLTQPTALATATPAELAVASTDAVPRLTLFSSAPRQKASTERGIDVASNEKSVGVDEKSGVAGALNVGAEEKSIMDDAFFIAL